MSREVISLGSIADEALSFSFGAPPFLVCFRSLHFIQTPFVPFSITMPQDVQFSLVLVGANHGMLNRVGQGLVYLHSLYTI